MIFFSPCVVKAFRKLEGKWVLFSGERIFLPSLAQLRAAAIISNKNEPFSGGSGDLDVL